MQNRIRERIFNIKANELRSHCIRKFYKRYMDF